MLVVLTLHNRYNDEWICSALHICHIRYSTVESAILWQSGENDSPVHVGEKAQLKGKRSAKKKMFTVGVFPAPFLSFFLFFLFRP